MDIQALIDPEIAEMLKTMPRMDGFAFDDLPAMRAQRNALLSGVQLSSAVERTDYTVPGGPGAQT